MSLYRICLLSAVSRAFLRDEATAEERGAQVGKLKAFAWTAGTFLVLLTIVRSVEQKTLVIPFVG
jgi:hypothetical protein